MGGDPFDYATMFWVDNTQVGGIATVSGQDVIFAPSVISGLNVSLDYYFSPTSATQRSFLALNNPTGAPITIQLDYANNYGSDCNTSIGDTSSGDTVLSTADNWVVTTDGFDGDPINTTVFQGPDNSGSAVVIAVSETVFSCTGTQGTLITYSMTIPAGATQSIMIFQQLNATVPDAQTDAVVFNAQPLPAEFTAGLTDEELGTVANFSTGPTITCPGDFSVNTDAGQCGAIVNYDVTAVSDGGGPANVLFVSDNSNATELPGLLTAEGYTVTTVLNDFSGGNNTVLQGNLSAYNLIVWHAIGTGFGSTHAIATTSNLESWVQAGGKLFVTGYDVISSPSDTPIINLLGGTGQIDTGGSTSSVTGPANSLNTGLFNIIGLTVLGVGDEDNLTGLQPGTVNVLPQGSDTSRARWALRTAGSGEVAWVSTSQRSTFAFPQWNTVGSGYYEAIRNFASNASGVSIAQTAGLASGSEFPVGTTTNTFVATDGDGNTATCSFDVTVEDNEAPNVICQTATVQLDDSGNGTLTTAEVDNGSTDNCGAVSLSLGSGISATNSAVLTLGNGNDGEGIAFNPNDGFMYHVSGISDGTEYFEPIDLDLLTVGANLFPSNTSNLQELAGIVWYPPLNGFVAMDLSRNISLIDTSGTITALSTFSGGFVLRGFAVVGTSIYGVSRNSSNLFEFNPNTGAVISSVPVVIDGVERTSGSTGITTDPNTGDVYIIYKGSGGISQLGTIDVTTGIGTSIGTTGMKFSGISFDNSGNLYAVSGDGATPSETLFVFDGGNSSSSINFTCDDIGTNTVTLNVTDVNGNISSCTTLITVEDNVVPNAIAQDVTVTLDAAGNGTLTAAEVDNGSNDNCGSVTLSIDNTSFTCADIAAPALSNDLFISEYMEGGSNNKCIEIYNGTGAQ